MIARATWVLPILAVLSSGACISLDTGQDESLWQAALTSGPAAPGLTGTAAAFSQRNGTLVGLTLDPWMPEAEYEWRLRRGTCDSPTTVVGPADLYPTVGDGDSADTFVPPRLQIGEEYHVVVLGPVEAEGHAACGALLPV